MGFLTLIIRALSRLSIATVVVVCLAVIWSYSRTYFHRPICPSYGGFTHPAFEEVKKSYIQNILSGFDKGSSFAIRRNGEALVDLWGGCADEHAPTPTPWTQDTLSQAWSATKGVTAILLATLVDRGRLDVHHKVARYWPEFAQNGKENITVSTLLSHRAGLSHLERPISLYEYRDNWTIVEGMMAKQSPLWEPGKRHMYHALTWGMYADALIRRADEKGRNATQYFQEEIADKIGDLDFYIGLPRDQYFRSTKGRYIAMPNIMLEILSTAQNWLFLPSMLQHAEIMYRAGHMCHFAKDMWVMDDPDMRSIGLPSSQGFGNARSLAKLFDFMANNGTVQGKTLLSPQMATLLSTPVNQDSTAISPPDFPITALGTAFDVNREKTVGHRGYGGQIAYADMKHGLAIGYVTNYKETFGMVEDPRISKVIDVFYECLEKFDADTRREKT